MARASRSQEVHVKTGNGGGLAVMASGRGSSSTVYTPISLFGDGSDGDLLVTSPDQLLTGNKQYRNVIFSVGASLITAGYYLRVNGDLDFTNGGLIYDDGSVATGNNGLVTGGTAGNGAPGNVAGVQGGGAGAWNGWTGNAPVSSFPVAHDPSNAIPTSSICIGGGGGGGGYGIADNGGALSNYINSPPSAGGFVTITNPNTIPQVVYTSDQLVALLNPYMGGGGGGGGGRGQGRVYGGGSQQGAGGGGGGIIVIYAKNIKGVANIRAAGAGPGAALVLGQGGPGGGGGGYIYVLYQSLNGSGSVSAPGGNGGFGNYYHQNGSPGVQDGGSGGFGGSGGNIVIIKVAGEYLPTPSQILSVNGTLGGNPTFPSEPILVPTVGGVGGACSANLF